MEELIAKYAKLPPRQRYAAYAALIALVLFGHWYLVYSGQTVEISNLETQYQALEAKRAQQQSYLENLPKYEARFNELQQSLNLARSLLPDDPDVPQLLAQLGTKAREAGLAIERFEPKDEKAQDVFAEIIFDVKVHGSYHEIGMFVDSLARLDRILNIAGISMTAPKSESSKIVVSGAFTIKTYRYLDESAAPAPKGKKK